MWRQPRQVLILTTMLLTALTLACALNEVRQQVESIVLLQQYQPTDPPHPIDDDKPAASSPEASPFLTAQAIDASTEDLLPAATYQIEAAEPMTSGPDGRFEIPAIAAPFTMRVELPGYQPWQQTLDSADFAPGTLLEIPLKPILLSGEVWASDLEQPLANVTLEAGTGPRSQTVTTNAAGQFELSRLQPGDPITVQPPPGYLPAQVTYRSQEVLTLTLTPRPLTVTVRDSFSAEPARGVAVSLDQLITATTNFRGQVTFSRVPATGRLTVSRSGYLSTTVTFQDQPTLDLSLTPAQLQGVIRAADTREPLPLATLYLGETILQADEDGRFSLTALPTQPEQLMVKAAGYHRSYAHLAQTGILTHTSPPFSGVEGRWLTLSPCAEPLPRVSGPCLDLHLEPFAAKVIYVPFGYLRNREAIIKFLDFVAETELNAIIVDVKGDYGFLGWDSKVELAEEIGADDQWTTTWIDLSELVREAKKRQVYTIARMVVFKDDPLAHARPDLAVVRADGTVWIDGEELGWASPFKEEVWAYNIALAQEVAAFGFDEINFDYIRFPSDGSLAAITYAEESTPESRTAAIREFSARMQAALQPYGIFTSADVFGLTVWVEPESDMQIGQRVIDIAPHIDYLAPMIYPSTFIAGNLGYADPSAEPYNVIFRSQTEAMSRVPPQVKVRPWLQAYWYSLEEMALQKQAAEDAGSSGWSWWNAGGSYPDELFALPKGE